MGVLASSCCVAEPEWTRDKFHEKLITVKPNLARQLLETKLEDLTGIGDSDALFDRVYKQQMAGSGLKFNFGDGVIM